MDQVRYEYFIQSGKQFYYSKAINNEMKIKYVIIIEVKLALTSPLSHFSVVTLFIELDSNKKKLTKK